MKIFIQNHNHQLIAVEIDETRPQKGLAFVVHGLGGWRQQPQVVAAAEGFRDAGCTVVRFDTTNSVGESDGEYSKATVTQFYEDLDSVILWAREQSWFEEPFFLGGHSLGGIAVGLFAECYSSLTRGLVLLSSVISGKLSLQTVAYSPDTVARWKESGWLERKNPQNGQTLQLPWSHMEDRLKYDLLTDVSKLKMPVLQVVGSVDANTPLAHQKILYEHIPSNRKSLEVIEGAPHTFTDEEHLTQLRKIVGEWETLVT